MRHWPTGFLTQVLGKLGLVAILAGFLPPAVHVFDAVTTRPAEAVVADAAVSGFATVTFHTDDGRAVVTLAPLFKLGRSAVAAGDRVEVAYRVANPEHLAPPRRMSHSLVGLVVLMLGMAMMAQAGRGSRLAGGSGATQPAGDRLAVLPVSRGRRAPREAEAGRRPTSVPRVPPALQGRGRA